MKLGEVVRIKDWVKEDKEEEDKDKAIRIRAGKLVMADR